MDTQNTDLPKPPTSAEAIELVAKRSGDDAERRQRVDLARQKAIGETWDDATDTLDDDARLDIFARFYLTASGTNRRKILTHPACPPGRRDPGLYQGRTGPPARRKIRALRNSAGPLRPFALPSGSSREAPSIRKAFLRANPRPRAARRAHSKA